MKNIFNYLLFGAFLMTIISCQSEDYQGPIPYPTLMEAAGGSGLTTLVSAVRAVPGLEATLQAQPAITVFAPTNDAFANALKEFKASDLNDLVKKIGGVQNLQTILGFHVVPAVAFSKNLNATNVFTTLANQSITVKVTPGVVTVIDASGNTSRVIQADVQIENGVVHVIDRVLLPKIDLPKPTLVEAATSAGLTTLLSAVTAVDGLANSLLSANAITVFAPTNEAFAEALKVFKVSNLNDLVTKIGGVKNLEKVLGFHVVPAVAFSKDLAATNTFTTLSGQSIIVTKSGNTVSVKDPLGRVSQVVAADIAIKNGVVHVLNGMMLPKIDLPTIVEAATAANLTVLLQAVTAANLGGPLLNAQAITVFAPTNQAFTNLLTALKVNSLQELISTLGAPAVAKVLQFHVVPAVAFSFDLKEGAQSVPTLAGDMLTVTKAGSNVTVTDKAGTTWKVVAANVAIKNGVVHVIDGVLLPKL
jgi:transforming growth factor-beta-induced protein